MKLFEGKTKTERNKIIAAIALGVVALFTLYLAFGGSIFGSRTVARVSTSPTPAAKASPSPGVNSGNFNLPTQEEQDAGLVVPITYNGGSPSAPDAGRNIFAFYEPPPPTPYVPTPPPVPSYSPPPTPVPPNVGVSFVNPPGVYAGTKAFRMEVNGDRFTPDVRIYFHGSEMPTTFVSPNQLTTDIPANFIVQEGSKVIEVRSADGKLFSNQFTFNVQAAPRPQFQYIGLIARKRANNDTAVFQEAGKPTPFGARLNDIVPVGGRFRLVSISSNEVILEDTNLGFRHRLALSRPAAGAGSTTGPVRNSFPGAGEPFNPANPFPNSNPNQPQQDIPGIPNNIPRAFPQPQPNTNTRRTIDPSKKDVDDDDDDGDN